MTVDEREEDGVVEGGSLFDSGWPQDGPLEAWLDVSLLFCCP